MPPSRKAADSTLSALWSAPADLPGGAGRPIACVATTYTFHAPFFEAELLPRFLGLKFDSTEAEAAFVIEREQALGEVRASVLVDADHVDPNQTTLRWDQLPVRIPGGAQHSKVVILLWENCLRLVVASANLTRSGYRRNREIVAALDFFGDGASAPTDVAEEAIAFVEALREWARGAPPALERLERSLEEARRRLSAWVRKGAPRLFTPRETPRVVFVPALPKGGHGPLQSERVNDSETVAGRI